MSQFSIIEQWQKDLPIDIPPLWQVLYYEGMHGHHILFKPDDISKFEGQKLPTIGEAKNNLKAISTIGFCLLKAPSFREMVSLIDTLDLECRALVFQLYKNWLADMRQRLKNLAH